jgi:3-phenylpropionate/trans-cinnamate dioxygenase ferredoxin reductase subunit
MVYSQRREVGLPRVVIVGAGQAGSSLACKLRALGHTGPITIIGEESVLPYERPPLSKAYLLGNLEQERLFLRPHDFYSEQQIEVITGCRVDAIDCLNRRVSIGDQQIEYDALALTTGSVARRLPAAVGGNLPGTFVVRGLDDIDAIRAACKPGGRALVVGGGYIGLEASAAFRKLGMQVTLVEMASRILQRVAASQTSDYFRELHRQNGVQILEETSLVALHGDSRVTGATLSDGVHIDVDLVVVGVGIDPATGLAAEAGLEIVDGIAVDAFGRTSDAAIWAAGDCTSFPYRGRRIRLESVPHAGDQAMIVAENMLGGAVEYTATPWFWSDQYDVKLQIAGLSGGFDHVVVRPGPRDGAVSHWYYKGDNLLAVDAINDPRSFMAGRRLLEHEVSVDPRAIADTTVNLKDLIPV